MRFLFYLLSKAYANRHVFGEYTIPASYNGRKKGRNEKKIEIWPKKVEKMKGKFNFAKYKCEFTGPYYFVI